MKLKLWLSVDFKILKFRFDEELNSSFYVHSKRLLFFILFIDPQIQNSIPHYCYDDLKNTFHIYSKDLDNKHSYFAIIHGIN